jgi:hypothetical protein
MRELFSIALDFTVGMVGCKYAVRFHFFTLDLHGRLAKPIKSVRIGL